MELSFLENAGSTQDPVAGRQKMLGYGEGGTGKTLFLGSWPKPFLLSYENGNKTLKKQGFELPSLSFPLLDVRAGRRKPFSETMMTLDYANQRAKDFASESKYKGTETICMDGWTSMSSLFLAEIKKENGLGNYDKPGFDEWGALKERMKTVIDFIQNMDLFFASTAHLAWKETAPDVLSPMPDAEGSVRNLLPYAFDEFYLFLAKSQGGDVRYSVRTKPWRNHPAKSREDLPSEVEWEGFPSYEQLYGDWKQYV